MSTPARRMDPRPVPVVATVVRQHAEEAALLHRTRTTLTEAPDVRLAHLRRFDDRVEAHLDGLRIAGEPGWRCCETALGELSAGTMFTAATRALEQDHGGRIDQLCALAEKVPVASTGLISAFGWLEGEQLRGTVARLLGRADAFSRLVGIAACSLHRVDAGDALEQWVRDPRPAVRARALRMAGEIGRLDLMSACGAATADDDDDARFRAAWSAVLLGDRNRAVKVLTRVGLAAGRHRHGAARLALQVMPLPAAREMVRELARNEHQRRGLIEGTGVAGDPASVPWLISQMTQSPVARVAAEAFTLVTGCNLESAALDGGPPEGFQSGPTGDPDDPDIDMDPDDGLPWPDVRKVEAWWASNSARFEKGVRYFMGAPVTREHCIDVLKNGYQRQRILAAHYLCLLNPGTPLFNTSAPAWRQQRLLAQM